MALGTTVALAKCQSLRTRSQAPLLAVWQTLKNDMDTLNINHFSTQKRKGWVDMKKEGERQWRANEAEPTGAGYRIAQIILPQRSIQQEQFAAQLLH